LDQDVRVVSDFAGDVMMILPDLVRRVAPSGNEIPKLQYNFDRVFWQNEPNFLVSEHGESMSLDRPNRQTATGKAAPSTFD
jgi:hypothetical protein